MLDLLLPLYVIGFLWLVLPRIRTAWRRQRVLTWPQARAHLGDTRVKLAESKASAHLQQPYTYYVKGQAYTSDRIEPGFRQQHRHYRNMTRFHLMRREPRAFFDPRQPEEAYLQPGRDPLSWSIIVGGGVLAVALAWLV